MAGVAHAIASKRPTVSARMMAHLVQRWSRVMEIIVAAPASLPVPPYHGYGGRQRGIHDFVKFFSRRGHTIHLIAPGDSNVADLPGVTLHAPIPAAIKGPRGPREPEVRASVEAEHLRGSLAIVLK